jgi:hypothetical protein
LAEGIDIDTKAFGCAGCAFPGATALFVQVIDEVLVGSQV